MKEYHYEINGQAYRVKIGKVTDTKAQVTVNDNDYTIQIKSPPATMADVGGATEVIPAAARPKAATGGNGVVRAPLPGVIIKVLVDVGDSVNAGERVMIIEAMKMENDIKAPVSGTITSIKVGAGDSVNTNDELFSVA